MKRVILALSMLGLSVAGACSGSSDEARSAPVVRDSLGIRIVENVGQAWSDADVWTLGPQPALEIGVVQGDPAHMLSQVRNPLRLADGSVALIDGSTRQIRVFDATGQHLRSVGRQGQGPGEFQSPWGLTVIAGDSLLVGDLQGGRVTVHFLDGTLGRVFTLAERASEFQRPEYRRIFPNGDILASASPTPDERRNNRTGARWSKHLLVRYSAEGTDPRVLGEVESVPCDPEKNGECSFIAYGPIGTYAVHDDRLYTSRPDRNEISVFAADGQLLSKIRGAAPLQPVTTDMRADFLSAVIAGDPNRQAELREYVSQASFSEVVPAFMHFLISKDGYIWTREYQVELAPFGYTPLFPPRTDPIRWTVFDREGSELGQVLVPVNFEISKIGEDYLLGVARDELEVERVRMYSLVKPEQDP